MAEAIVNKIDEETLISVECRQGLHLHTCILDGPYFLSCQTFFAVLRLTFAESSELNFFVVIKLAHFLTFCYVEKPRTF